MQLASPMQQAFAICTLLNAESGQAVFLESHPLLGCSGSLMLMHVRALQILSSIDLYQPAVDLC